MRIPSSIFVDAFQLASTDARRVRPKYIRAFACDIPTSDVDMPIDEDVRTVRPYLSSDVPFDHKVEFLKISLCL